MLFVARRPRPDRRRRPLHRRARLRARGAGRDRAEQGRPAQAGAHRLADADGRAARRLPRAAPGEREDGRRRSASCATSSSGCCPEGPAYFARDQRTDLPLEVQIAELVREKALHLTKEEVPHALTAQVDELDDEARRGDDLRRDRVAEADPRRQGRRGWCGRSARAPGRRSRRCSATRSSSSCRVKARPQVAARRDDARAARHLNPQVATWAEREDLSRRLRRARRPVARVHVPRRRGHGELGRDACALRAPPDRPLRRRRRRAADRARPDACRCAGTERSTGSPAGSTTRRSRPSRSRTARPTRCRRWSPRSTRACAGRA